MAYTANKALAQRKRYFYDFDPDSTAATLIGAYQSLKALGGVRYFLAALFRSVGTGSVGSFVIKAATSSTGAGAATVVSHAIGSAPNAVGDFIFLEASEEQIRAALANATHAGAFAGLVTSTDECVGYYEYEGKHVQDAATADFIS